MSKGLGIGFVIGAAVSSTVASAFNSVESRLQQTRHSLAAASREAKAFSAALDLQKKRDALVVRVKESGGTDDKARRELASVSKRYHRAKTAALAYGAAVGEWSKRQKQAARSVESTYQRLTNLSALQEQSNRRSELRGQMVGTAVSALSLAAPIKTAVNFESVMADAAKTIDGMRDETGKLTPAYYDMEAAVKRMGRSLPLAHAEIAALFAAGGQQGMTGTKELEEFAALAAHMSVSFGMSTEEAADAVGGYRSAMKLTIPEARSMLDLMNKFANTTSASEKGIAEVVRRIGPLGNVGGIAAKPMTALAATLDAMKVAPEVAATGIKNLILAMTAGSAATKSQKDAFAQLGIDTVKLARQMQEDGPAAIVSVLESIKKLPKAEQLSLMKQIFGSESLGAISPLLDSLDTVKKNFALAGDEAKYAGAMQQEFENRSRTTANALVLFKNRIAETGITLGSALLPPLVAVMDTFSPLVSSVADFAQRHQTLTTVLTGAAAGFVGVKIAAMGTLYVWSSLRSSGVGLALAWGKLPAPFRAHAAAVLTGAGASLKAAAAYVSKKAAALAAAAATRTMTAAQRLYTIATQGSIRAVPTSTVALARQRAAAVLSTAALKATAVGQRLLNAAMSANPVGLVIAGIAGLAAGLAWLYRNCEPVRTALDSLWSGVKATAKFMGAILVTPFAAAFQAVKALFSAVGDGVGSLAQAISVSLQAVWDVVKGAGQAARQAVSSAWSGIGAFFSSRFSEVYAACTTVWTSIGSFIGGIWDSVRAKASALFDWLASKFEWLSTVTDFASSAWDTAKSWVGMGDDEQAPVADPGAPEIAKRKGWFDAWFGKDEEKKAPVTAASPVPAVVAPESRAAFVPTAVTSEAGATPASKKEKTWFDSWFGEDEEKKAPVTAASPVPVAVVPESKAAFVPTAVTSEVGATPASKKEKTWLDSWFGEDEEKKAPVTAASPVPVAVAPESKAAFVPAVVTPEVGATPASKKEKTWFDSWFGEHEKKETSVAAASPVPVAVASESKAAFVPTAVTPEVGATPASKKEKTWFDSRFAEHEKKETSVAAASPVPVAVASENKAAFVPAVVTPEVKMPRASAPETTVAVPPLPPLAERVAQSSRVPQVAPSLASAALRPASAAPASQGPQVATTFDISLHGMPDVSFAEGVVRAIREHKSEIERLLNDIVHNQARLAYGR